MASLRDIRNKIKSVKNIQKITKAMKMVAAAKLKKVQERASQGRPYAEKMRELVLQVSPHAGKAEHPLLQARPVKKIGIVVISGDKGLCGSYNNNIIRKAEKEAKKAPVPVSFYTIGRKGSEYFTRRGYDLSYKEMLPPVGAGFGQISHIARNVTDWFLSGAVDEVWFAYTGFINVIRQEPRLVKFLPIQPEAVTGQSAAGGTSQAETQSAEYIFEPEAGRLLSNLIPKFVNNQIYHYLLESMTSEQGARMNAMNQATDNAGDLIRTLTLQFNKARQWAITKEILEIVGGAEALKQVN